MSKQLSAEWQQKIEEEAEAYAEKTGDRLTNVKEYYTHSDREAGYIEAATHYASLLETTAISFCDFLNRNHYLKFKGNEWIKSNGSGLTTIHNLYRLFEENSKPPTNE